MKKQLLRAFVVMGTVFTLIAAQVAITPAVQAVTSEDISEQRRVVMSSLVNVLSEQVTLFQLVVINRLENQVAHLQAQLDK